MWQRCIKQEKPQKISEVNIGGMAEEEKGQMLAYQQAFLKDLKLGKQTLDIDEDIYMLGPFGVLASNCSPLLVTFTWPSDLSYGAVLD